jgi:hypothetical protein
VNSAGPLYIFRNVYNRSRMLEGTALDSDNRNTFFKSGSQSSTLGDGRRYLFHNTALQATQAGSVYGLGASSGIRNAGLTLTNTVSRNNILQAWKSSSMTYGSSGTGNDFQFDLTNGTTATTGVSNVIAGVPTYASGNGWTSEAGGMYQLAPTSPGFDRGMRIPNFNDQFTGTAPDVGAHEAGTPAMVFGVKAAVSPAPTIAPVVPVAPVVPPPAPVTGSTPYTGTRVSLPGTIQAENYDLGGKGVAYFDTTAGNSGGVYRTGEDVDLANSCDAEIGGYMVGEIVTGEWLAYSVNVASSTNYDIMLRVADPYSGGAFHVEVDGVNVTGSVSGLTTGAWCTFKWVGKTRVPLTAGAHILKVVVDQQPFNLKAIRVSVSP